MAKTVRGMTAAHRGFPISNYPAAQLLLANLVKEQLFLALLESACGKYRENASLFPPELIKIPEQIEGSIGHWKKITCKSIIKDVGITQTPSPSVSSGILIHAKCVGSQRRHKTRQRSKTIMKTIKNDGKSARNLLFRELCQQLGVHKHILDNLL